ncbi:hypothetical protein PUN28_018159 [Cardiocondyla obscurior]|uniref:Uncharacterized protein n=1 Tax=Cardiocondyla obscurior TaxID=286306 RepID=A0AAW2EHL9_9HYME
MHVCTRGRRKDRFKRRRVQREGKRARTRPADGSNQHSSLITIYALPFVLSCFPRLARSRSRSPWGPMEIRRCVHLSYRHRRHRSRFNLTAIAPCRFSRDDSRGVGARHLEPIIRGGDFNSHASSIYP